MRFGYREGYSDALRDVFSWFDNHRHILEERRYKKRIKDLVLGFLKHFMKNQDRFFFDKECYELDIYIPNDNRKPIEIKPYLSDKQPKYIHKKA